MSLFFWSSAKDNQPPKYNPDNDHIITYNISGKLFSFSVITLSKYKGTNLYKYAYEVPNSKLVLDDNQLIYLDMSSIIFQHIHDYIKGYNIRIQDMDIKTKEQLLRDADILNIKSLVGLIKDELPVLSPELMNKWANFIAKSLISVGINVESMVESCTGKKLEYPLSIKIRDLFENNKSVRQKIRKCVQNILETQYQKNNAVDGLLLQMTMEMSNDTEFQSLIASIMP
jgi:hypothetical protein